MPLGTRARRADSAPDESPILVDCSLRDAVAVSFTASGLTEHGRPGHPRGDPPPSDPPEGSHLCYHKGHAEHGIADVWAPIDSLVGVFLGDDRPDRTRAPQPLYLRSGGRNLPTLSPLLKQVFCIGSGITEAGERRRFLIPKGATRLFLGMMDGDNWNNNVGSFHVTMTIERTEVSSHLFSVDSQISFAEWPCLPDRSQCTPERPIVKQLGPGQYHVLLPAHLEWGVSIPTPPGAVATVQRATGTVCLDSQSRSTGSCKGPAGDIAPAGAGFLAPDRGAGALIDRTDGGQTRFSVNDRPGISFQTHQGFFEFDVTIRR